LQIKQNRNKCRANYILFHAFHVGLQLRLPVPAAQTHPNIEIAYLLRCHVAFCLQIKNILNTNLIMMLKIFQKPKS